MHKKAERLFTREHEIVSQISKRDTSWHRTHCHARFAESNPRIERQERKMLDMSQIERIRDMLADGYTPTEVKETL